MTPAAHSTRITSVRCRNMMKLAPSVSISSEMPGTLFFSDTTGRDCGYTCVSTDDSVCTVVTITDGSGCTSISGDGGGVIIADGSRYISDSLGKLVLMVEGVLVFLLLMAVGVLVLEEMNVCTGVTDECQNDL